MRRQIPRVKIKIWEWAAVITLLSLTLGSECELQPVIPADLNPYWDSDGDNISDAVETNPANAEYGFDVDSVDADPSIAHGTPTSGWLEGGLNMPDAGEGYYHYYGPDTVVEYFDDWGTLTLINMLEGGGRSSKDGGLARIGFGDLSLKAGGDWQPHDSHQNGLDVDIRYLRKDGAEDRLDIGTNYDEYDVTGTVKMINLLIETQIPIALVYVHPNVGISARTEPLPQIIYRVDHYNHFHVRIIDPDGTGN
ncbi:MAG: penicillin-insensitive murein endopeptidase [Candidatus Marinimicrobia bacterium]|nr:penicillin-insensitive murein endopeptidase [Candidatus Neomarinimicrobiota bacterium]